MIKNWNWSKINQAQKTGWNIYYLITFILMIISVVGIFIKYKKQKEHYGNPTPNFYIGESSIEGMGVFAAYDIPSNRKIGIGFYERLSSNGKKYGIVDQNFGAYINHCKNSNTYLKKELDVWWVMSARNIFKGEEVTANYWKTPEYIEKPKAAFNELC